MPDPRLIWEVTIDASNDRLEFDEGGGALGAVLTQGDFYLRGGGAAGSDLAANIAAAMSLAGANTYTVTISDNGTVTIARSAGALNFTLHWLTDGTNETGRIGAILGFDVTADDGPGTSFASDGQHRYGWYPEKPLLDGRRVIQTAVAGGARSMGNQQYAQEWATDWRTTLRIDFVPAVKVRNRDIDGTFVDAAAINESFSGAGLRFYETARTGARFEVHPDTTDHASFATCVVDAAEAGWWQDQDEATPLLMEAGERYRVLIPVRAYTA